MRNNRNNFDNDDSDEEDLGLLKKALNVQLPDDFDPNRVPTTGEEYLQRVMYEAKHCDQIVVADISHPKIKASRGTKFEITVNDNCKKPPKDASPSISWQLEQVKKFELFRLYHQKQVFNLKNSNHKPNLNEPPTFSLVANLTQPTKIDLLQTIANKLDAILSGEGVPYNICIWIYALLAGLELPLCPDSCHILRELARKCSVVRSNLFKNRDNESEHSERATSGLQSIDESPNLEKDDVQSLNLFICLIARFFRQLDLADEDD